MEFNWWQLSPHIILAGAALALVAGEVVWRRAARAVAPYFTVLAALGAAVAAVYLWRGGAGAATSWFGALTVDGLFVVFAVIFAVALALVALLSTGFAPLRGADRPEYFAFLLLVTSAATFMASATNLVLIYVAVEFSSILSYVLVGYLRGDRLSGEAGLKYFLYGAAASAVMLMGFVLLYGMTGATDLRTLATLLPRYGRMFGEWGHVGIVVAPGFSQPPAFIFLAFALVLVGLGYKISVVPFHMWAPDAYQGAPTPVAAFLSVVSKASGFAVIMRLVLALHGSLAWVYAGWTKYLAALAVASMVFGVLIGIVQKDARRLLAYSAIAHAGFVLLGVVADTSLGYASVLVYLALYAAMNVGAFGAVAVIGHMTGRYDLDAYAGLARRHPLLAAAFTVFLLALAGIPPLAGFFAKFYVLAALIDRGYIFLAVVAIAASVVALFLYARILKQMYFARGEGAADEQRPAAAAVWALVICFLLTLGLGLWPQPLVNWAKEAVVPLLPRV